MKFTRFFVTVVKLRESENEKKNKNVHFNENLLAKDIHEYDGIKLADNEFIDEILILSQMLLNEINSKNEDS